MKMYIYLKSYNSNLLNQFCSNFVKKNKYLFSLMRPNIPFLSYFFRLKGPIFLPTKRKNYVVIRSPHVYSLSRERFSVCVYRRLFVFERVYNFLLVSSFFDKFLHEKESLLYDFDSDEEVVEEEKSRRRDWDILELNEDDEDDSGEINQMVREARIAIFHQLQKRKAEEKRIFFKKMAEDRYKFSTFFFEKFFGFSFENKVTVSKEFIMFRRRLLRELPVGISLKISFKH